MRASESTTPQEGAPTIFYIEKMFLPTELDTNGDDNDIHTAPFFIYQHGELVDDNIKNQKEFQQMTTSTIKQRSQWMTSKTKSTSVNDKSVIKHGIL